MQLIIDLIHKKGAITVAEFMEIAMYQPEQGYYINCNPLGKDGDFITSPEISQLFGEIIGIYVADTWLKLGAPKLFHLIELGPGKGTLMFDLLRATKHVDGLHQAMQIHLVERNHYLAKVQKKALSNLRVTWHKTLDSIQLNAPIIIIANEFFDCLPINQYIKLQNKWYERLITLKGSNYCFTTSDISTEIGIHPHAKESDILEICYAASDMIKYISKILKQNSGHALIIDYGYYYDPSNRKIYGETLQAIKNHKFHSFFQDVGKADLTAHVDFTNLKQVALENNILVNGPLSQQEFLITYGINIRAEILKQHASLEQKAEINLALNRLTKEMGQLFKAIELKIK